MSDALRLLDHPLSSALGWSLVHFVWQGALIGLAAFILLRGVRPAQSHTRYAIGVGALMVMFLAPVVTFMAGASAPRALALSSDIVSTVRPERTWPRMPVSGCRAWSLRT